MGKLKIKIMFFIFSLLFLCIFSCSRIPDESVTAKYTNEIALAIIDGSWKIGASIVVASIIRVIFANDTVIERKK